MKKLETLIDKIAHVLDEKQGANLRIYHVSAYSSLADFIIVVTAKNKVHCRAVLDAVDKEISSLKKDYFNDVSHIKISGVPESGWVVLDTGSIVIHIMEEDVRETYELDGLFEKRSVIYHP